MTVPSCVRLIRADNPGPMTLDGTNTWLIEDGTRWAVVDPGPLLPEHLDALTDATDGRVSQILLTHGHPDHAEGAGHFAERVGAAIRATDPRHLRNAERLADQEVIQLAGSVLTVLSTPGHTGDSASFLLRADQEAGLFTGDTVLGNGTTVLMPPDGTLRDYLASLDRLEQVAMDLYRDGLDLSLLPGHGPLHLDAVPVIAYYISHRQERLDQIRAQIADGVTEAKEIVNAVYADVPESVKSAALLSVQAQLEYLAEVN
jgi:glyoxylase-like metal-dependent hydrolase (beta-lactamase superfamily II)